MALIITIFFLVSISGVRSGEIPRAANNNSVSAEAKALIETGWWSTSNGTAVHHCRWRGIECNNAGSVIEVNLSDQGLNGSIPPQIGALSKLQYLDLSWNNFRGELPPSFGNLTQLTLLDISYNYGIDSIPSMAFENMRNLVYLNLSGNSIVQLPSAIGLLTNLTHLIMDDNPLEGQFPPIWNLQNLMSLHLGQCKLSGPIPQNIGKLKSLVDLDLSYNKLVGPIPSSLTNLTHLASLFLQGNKLNGSIPTNLEKLKSLVDLDLSNNMLVGPIPSSLTSLTHLASLFLQSNKLNGSIQPNIEKLKSLVDLNLSNNTVVGPIPSSITNLTHLASLFLQGNKLNGSIPPNIEKLKSLVDLDVSNNMLVGPIPSSLTNLTHLASLFLRGNKLNGSIPREIGKLKNLYELDLSENKLSGIIPTQIGNLSNLRSLFLANNNLNGRIPLEIFSLPLNTIDLSHNFIGGDIPSQLFHLSYSSLHIVNLSHNFLQGVIPSSFGSLNHISILDLSCNHLTGMIPQLIPFYVDKLNLSFNSLWGPIPYGLLDFPPETFTGNQNLCGDVPGIPSCFPSPTANWERNRKVKHNLRIRVLVPTFLLLVSTFSLVMLILFRRYKSKTSKLDPTRPTKNTSPTKNGDLFSVWNFDGSIAFEDIIKATEDFDLKYCIGTGGYGSVYKAVLPTGKVVALKKLHRLEAENPAFDTSFRNEIKFLTEIRHKNIVKLHGFCLHNCCMFLIYGYLENGSLFYSLSVEDEAVELDWTKRVNIVKGVAHALSYLHHDCSPPVVHRDISSNNILLNSKLEASVSDFGTARLLDPDSSNQTVIAGTYGC